MGYLHTIGDELAEKLPATLPEQERTALVRWVQSKILESYKNGVAQGKERTTVTWSPETPPV